jgi:hypothetical protein
MGKSIQKLSSVTRLGLDLAKKVFQVHAVDVNGEIVVAPTLARGRLVGFFCELPRCVVAMEASSREGLESAPELPFYSEREPTTAPAHRAEKCCGISHPRSTSPSMLCVRPTVGIDTVSFVGNLSLPFS